jgi:hypothetical protein
MLLASANPNLSGEDGDTRFQIPDTKKLLTAGDYFCGFLILNRCFLWGEK